MQKQHALNPGQKFAQCSTTRFVAFTQITPQKLTQVIALLAAIKTLLISKKANAHKI